MRQKVLITGAAGRIAQWVIPLLETRFDLHLTDKQEGEIDGRTIHRLDITDYAAVRNAMRGMDAVVHLAIAALRYHITDKQRFRAGEGEELQRFNDALMNVNLRGTYHIFEAARLAGTKRVIYGSSLTVISGHNNGTLDDTLPPRPQNFYAVTKLWGEQLGEFYSREYGLTVYCLRFGTPYPQPEHPSFKVWTQRPAGQMSWVTFRDMANAIECGLTTTDGPPFGAYTIISATNHFRYDCSKAGEIGWSSLGPVECLPVRVQ